MADACPFCAPDPARVFYEGALVFGCWDGFPVSPGHALLIPRRHVASWFEVTREEQLALLEGIDRAREEILKRHGPAGFNIGVNVGQAAGQTIFHVHVHVIPRYRGDVPNPRGGVRHVIPDKADYIAGGALSVEPSSKGPGSVRLVRGERDPLLPHLLADLDRAVGAEFAVAFVVRSGVRLVAEHLRDLLARGGKVRFLTGDYLDVTEPQALREILDLGGALELRIFECREMSFHPKAFILRFEDGSGTAYVGSSNLTETALEAGVEWNYRIISSSDHVGFADVLHAFQALFRHPATRPADEGWIRAYDDRRDPRRIVGLATPREKLEPPPELLRNWFGTAAGKPGTRFHVRFGRRGEVWTMAPARQEGRIQGLEP